MNTYQNQNYKFHIDKSLFDDFIVWLDKLMAFSCFILLVSTLVTSVYKLQKLSFLLIYFLPPKTKHFELIKDVQWFDIPLYNKKSTAETLDCYFGT